MSRSERAVRPALRQSRGVCGESRPGSFWRSFGLWDSPETPRDASEAVYTKEPMVNVGGWDVAPVVFFGRCHDPRGASLPSSTAMSAPWNTRRETAAEAPVFIVARSLAQQGHPSDATCEAANAAAGRSTSATPQAATRATPASRRPSDRVQERPRAARR